MRSNILIDLLPKTVEINGVDVEINSDFRTSILFELLMQDGSISDKEKILQSIDLYFVDLPKQIFHNRKKEDVMDTIVDAILYFYSGEKKQEDNSTTSQSDSVKSNRIYCLEQDADYIYAAFLDQYGIDLQDVDYLHWWKFKAMFKALKSDSEIVKIMGYRSITISKDMSKQQKSFYKKMKQIHKLKDNRTEIEKEKMVADTLSSLF